MQLLQLRGCDVWVNNNIPVRGRKFLGRVGSSDIIGIHKKTGMFVACEVKTKTDYFSLEQIEFLGIVRRAGGLSLVAYEDSVGGVALREFDL